MKRIKCAGVIFVDDNNKILLEDRRKISKHGEDWSFFGGSIEEGETIEEALVREVKEELGYILKDYNFFLEHRFQVEDADLDLTYYMFLAEMPDLKQLRVHENASLGKFTVDEALSLKMTGADKEILKSLKNYLLKSGGSNITQQPLPL